MKHIIFIVPSLSVGGLERVISKLSWEFVKKQNLLLSIICLTKAKIFFDLPSEIKLYEPDIALKETIRGIYLIKLMFWLRQKTIQLKPDVLLSFGGKYNSFVIISLTGLKIQTYISDRSSPTISYGRFLDFLNPIVYKNVNGIIAQTERAKKIMYERTKHPNIRVIGNPITGVPNTINDRENIILNVGRFIPSKNQELLVRYFAQLKHNGWKLIFLGDGYFLEHVRNITLGLSIGENVEFKGSVKNINDYYKRSKIFAFTSVSEGFPNALGEAMAAGLACISFNCEAGPSDLIDDGLNGFLIEEKDDTSYINKLQLLMDDEVLLNNFSLNAREKISKFSVEQIGQEYLNFLTEERNETSN